MTNKDNSTQYGSRLMIVQTDDIVEARDNLSFKGRQGKRFAINRLSIMLDSTRADARTAGDIARYTKRLRAWLEADKADQPVDILEVEEACDFLERLVVRLGNPEPSVFQGDNATD